MKDEKLERFNHVRKYWISQKVWVLEKCYGKTLTNFLDNTI